MISLRALPLLLLLLVTTALPGLAAPPDLEARIDALLGKMTLEEKLGQLQQLDGDADGTYRAEHPGMIQAGTLGSTLNVRGARRTNELQRIAMEKSRLKIPFLFAFDVIHGYRTIFPVPLGEASSWDPRAAELSARIAACEASAAGVRWTFAPMVDIARDPRWGRIVEGAGEDPYLGSVLAAARVRGFQGKDLSAPDAVAACAKHWVAYGAAMAGRDYNSTDVSERTLREIYFPPFQAALRAGCATVMSAFNDLNGVPTSGNPWTLTDVLRREWKWDGVVVSDYTAVAELIPHGLAADGAEAAAYALLAGVDVEMVSRLMAAHIPKLVKWGLVNEPAVDEAVRRVLRLKMRLGLFERPYTDESREASMILAKDHLTAARVIAGRSMVLLRNEGGVLPLSPERSVAVIGALADDPKAPLGSWIGDGRSEDTVTLLRGLREGTTARVTHAAGWDREGQVTPASLAQALEVARQAETVVIVAGEHQDMSGEASSRSSLDLPGDQARAIRSLKALGRPTVLVLMNGRPLTLGSLADEMPAILEIWYPGTEAGHALADVLFGQVNPSAKLPVTWPRNVGQIPLFYNQRNTGRPPGAEKYTSKYLDVPVTPQWPFGHGLSYTTFVLSDLRLSSATMDESETLTVTARVRNTGKRAGDEIVQLYLRDVAASVTRPVRELKGFQRVSLKPGEEKTVRFEIGREQLQFLDRSLKPVVEPGQFRVWVGQSSEGGLEGSFVVD